MSTFLSFSFWQSRLIRYIIIPFFLGLDYSKSRHGIKTYHANRQAWMIGILFQEYIRQLDRKINDRKVLLLVGAFPLICKTIKGLENIEYYFSSHPTQRQIFSLLIQESIGLLRCIIIVNFIEAFWWNPKLNGDKYFRCNESYNLDLVNECSSNFNCKFVRHFKFRSRNNMTSKNLDQCSNDESPSPSPSPK